MAAILTKAKMRINFSMDDDMVLRPITRRSQLNARRQVMWPLLALLASECDLCDFYVTRYMIE